MVIRIRVALPHPTYVHNLPDRRIRRDNVKVTPQITVPVAGDEPVPDYLDPCTRAHISKSPNRQCF